MSIIRSLLSRREARVVVTLLSKPGCHLCEEAEDAVRSVFGPRYVRILDISDDRALEDRYVFRIPVLLADGQVLAEGRITREEARQALRCLRRRQRAGVGQP